MKPKRDDGLEWLRAIRRQMAAESQYDPKKLGRFYRQLQHQFRERIARSDRQLTAGK